MRRSGTAIAVFTPLALAACVSAPVADSIALSSRLERDLGTRPSWARDAAARMAADQQITLLLGAPLDAQGAVQVALLSNPRVQAAFESLGIGQAAFAEAVRPAPVSLHVLELRPDPSGASLLTHGVSFDLLRLLALPAARRAGAGRLEANRAQATAEILQVAHQARLAWIELAAARQTADLMAQAAQAAGASAAAADALYVAGNIARVERDREALYAAEIAIADAQAQAALSPARERLVAALGLNPERAMRLQAIERLPPPPEAPIAVADLEAHVAGASTDLAVAAGTLVAARAQQSTSWLTSLASGLTLEGETEREDDARKQGLGLAWLAPLADLGSAERLRKASATRRAQALHEALDLELRAEARALLAEAEAARRIALTRRNVILPISANVFDGAVLDFNAMQIGILELLQERRARLQAGLGSIMAGADYWRAQARLELLLTGARAGPPSSARQAEATARPSGQDH